VNIVASARFLEYASSPIAGFAILRAAVAGGRDSNFGQRTCHRRMRQDLVLWISESVRFFPGFKLFQLDIPRSRGYR